MTCMMYIVSQGREGRVRREHALGGEEPADADLLEVRQFYHPGGREAEHVAASLEEARDSAARVPAGAAEDHHAEEVV